MPVQETARKDHAAIAVAGVLAAAGAGSAQDAPAAAREVVKKWQDAVVTSASC